MSEDRCTLTELPVSGCAHCRGITDTPERMTVPFWMDSHYSGRCASCGKHYHEGARIGRSDEAGGWIGECCGL